MAIAIPRALLGRLDQGALELLHALEEEYRFSHQQLKITAEWLIDTSMWQELGFRELIERLLEEVTEWENPKAARQAAFSSLRSEYQKRAGQPKNLTVTRTEKLPPFKVKSEELKGKIFRLCPAASEKAVCCNLKVINVVDNCAMACSYCVLQNHYQEPEIKIPTNLPEKLGEIKLNPDRRYRIGTGEYSDSLLWGNQNGILTALFSFAEQNPNVILELKTKSANVSWLLNHSVPKNVCCSWSLNPQSVIDQEEQKTAPLAARLGAARKVADKGIPVGFHLHPLMYIEQFEEQYRDLCRSLLEKFSPSEVLWISLGTVTLMPDVIKAVRTNYRHSQLLRMELEQTPDGKWTYPFELRSRLYSFVLDQLDPWKQKVFQYLCMEHRPMWERVMGFAYPNMDSFDSDFNNSAFAKL